MFLFNIPMRSMLAGSSGTMTATSVSTATASARSPAAAPGHDDALGVHVRKLADVLDGREDVLQRIPCLRVHVPTPVRGIGDNITGRQEPRRPGAQGMLFELSGRPFR